jgi:hypothetical protein
VYELLSRSTVFSLLRCSLTDPAYNGAMSYFLFKTEPDVYSFDDFLGDQETVWDGVTNPTAVKHLREMKAGTKWIFYHTGDERTAVGTGTVVSVDPTDPKVPIVRVKVGKRLKTAEDAGRHQGRAALLFLAFPQPALGIQQLPLIERPHLAGQLVRAFAFADRLIEFAGHGLHLGVQVVEEVQHQRLGNHGQLGRAELQLAVVRQNHVQHQRFQAGGKPGRLSMVFSVSADAHLDVAQQRSFDGVLEADLPAEFAHLADVVQESRR